MGWITVRGHHVFIADKGGVNTPTNQRNESLPKGMQTGGYPDNGTSTALGRTSHETALAHATSYTPLPAMESHDTVFSDLRNSTAHDVNFSHNGMDPRASAEANALSASQLTIGEVRRYTEAPGFVLTPKGVIPGFANEPSTVVTRTGGADYAHVHSALTAAGFTHVANASTAATTARNFYEKGSKGVAIHVEQGRATHGYIYSTKASKVKIGSQKLLP